MVQKYYENLIDHFDLINRPRKKMRVKNVSF